MRKKGVIQTKANHAVQKVVQPRLKSNKKGLAIFTEGLKMRVVFTAKAPLESDASPL
jgi:hypothetical protein